MVKRVVVIGVGSDLVYLWLDSILIAALTGIGLGVLACLTLFIN